MSITGYLKGFWWPTARKWKHWLVARRSPRLSVERSNWEQSLREPTEFYYECLRYFYQELPREIRDHRVYFYNVPGDRRGFGEHPFHVMWYLLLREFKPANFLEIGVFRGQTTSLVSYCGKLNGAPCEVHGISPFKSTSEVASFHVANLDYYKDTLLNFEHFGLPHPNLLRAYSTEPSALELIASRSWDLMYIDGAHDYEVALADWQACSQSVRPGGLIVMDDAAVTTGFKPPIFLGTRGLPGPSRVAEEIDRSRFREILQVGHNRVFQRIG